MFRISPEIRQIVFADDEMPMNCSVSINAPDMQLNWLHDNQPITTTDPGTKSVNTFLSGMNSQQPRFHETVVESKGVLTSMLVISQLKQEDTGL